MPDCQICITETNYKPICGCYICLDCIINWFGEKNQNASIEKFSCPNQNCQFTYSLTHIMKECQQQPYQEQLQSILVKQYLKSSDIRPCPNGKCNNFGYVDLKNLCDDLLECQACGMKWKDLQVSSYTFQLENALQNAYGNFKDFFYCFITANECPTCGVQIQRSGGCKHMTCKACNGQFCWQCKQNWIGHKPAQCGAQIFLFVGLAITFTLNFLDTIGILKYSLLMFYPIKWVLMLIFSNFLPLGIFISGYQLLPFTFMLFNGRRRQGFVDFLLSFGAIILLCVEYFIYGLVSDWFDMGIWDVMKILLFELIVGITLICFYQRAVFYSLSLALIACTLIYFLGINGIGMVVWLIPHCTDFFIDGYVFKIISYSGLFLWNIFDLMTFLTSYQFLIMIIIDLLIKKRRNKMRFFEYILYYTGLRRRRVII